MIEDAEIATMHKDFIEEAQKMILDKLIKVEKVPYTASVPDWFSTAQQVANLTANGERNDN
jgi:hypothetical protein